MAKTNIELVKKCGRLAFLPEEMEYILDLSESEKNQFTNLLFENHPEPKEFKRLRLSRLRRAGYYASKTKVQHRIRAALLGHIAHMVIRQMPPLTEMIGYSVYELMADFEHKFQEGMSWDNWGEWQIDHIKPRSLFGLDQIRECFDLSNLQPLWKADNIKKGSKYG